MILIIFITLYGIIATYPRKSSSNNFQLIEHQYSSIQTPLKISTRIKIQNKCAWDTFL